MDIKQLILDKTDLKEDQIIISRSFWGGYDSIYVIKDNKILHLGDYAYQAVAKTYLEKLKIFCDLCIKKYNGEIDKVPTLCGNQEYWADCYKG